MIHFAFPEALAALSTALGVTTAALGILAKSSARGKAIAIAVAAAETAIDKAAYTNGEINTVREKLALSVIDRLMPNANPDTIKADLEAILSVVHQHASDLLPIVTAPAAK